jgi:hypothetical protein
MLKSKRAVKALFRNQTVRTFAVSVVAFAFHLFAAPAASAKSSDSLKIETELRLRLTREGFEHLLDLWRGKSQFSERTDMYFDKHAGSRFLIKQMEPRAKLRLQDRGDECVLQKSWLTEQHTASSGGFVWTAATRSAAFSKHDAKSETCRRQMKSANFLLEKVSSEHISRNEIHELENDWARQSWPQHLAYDSGTAKLKGSLIPAAIVKKQRWVTTFVSATSKPLKIQLGRDTDLFANGQPENYELEIEAKDSSVEAERKILDELSDLLWRSGITPADTNPQNIYNFFQHLENLYANGR